MPVVQPDTTQSAPLEEGTYRAKIKSCDVAKSRQKGTNMIVPVFEIITGDGDTTELTSYLVIEGRGTFGFDALLRACHMDELANVFMNKDAEHPPFDTDVLLGQELLVVVTAGEYDGRPTANISNYLKV
jgi:hypothetical protein